MKILDLKFKLPLPVAEALLAHLLHDYVRPELAPFVLELERRVAAAKR